MADWNKRFIELAQHVASWSKDKSTQVASAIVDSDNRLISIGYNGFPSGCNDNVKERHERPLKYKWTEHAERNAIYNAARIGSKTNGAKMYMPWFPCSDCARGIIQAGIKELICGKPNFEDERWGEDFKIAYEMLSEAVVIITYYSGEEEKKKKHEEKEKKHIAFCAKYPHTIVGFTPGITTECLLQFNNGVPQIDSIRVMEFIKLYKASLESLTDYSNLEKDWKELMS